MKGFWPAFLIGLPLGALLAGALGFVAVRKELEAAKVGWALVPVVVAAEDVAEGTVLSTGSLAQRAVPERFVVDSMVRPDFATAIVGKRITVPLQAGDPVLWTSFNDHSRADRAEACALGIEPRVAPEVSAAAARALADIKPPEELGEAVLTAPPTGADGQAQVVTITRDLTEGTVLTRGDLEVRSAEPGLVTASWLGPGDLEAAVGKRLVVPMMKGDGVLWQLLEDAAHPSSPAGCEKVVAEATAAAEKAAAAREAKQWFEHEPPLAPRPKEAP